MRRPGWATNPDVQLADMLVHEAGHAVLAWELGVDILHLRFDVSEWSGLMPFLGMSTMVFAKALDREREAAERDMLVFHGGLMAQRLFHYESTHAHVPVVDLKGIRAAARRIEADTDLIDEWSSYIEQRARVMLYRPATWARVMALAPEIARRLYLSGAEIADFLRIVDATNATSPKDREWNRSEYPLGRSVDELDLSNRARTALHRGQIDTVAELLVNSRRDLRQRIGQIGDKTAQEIEARLATLGLRLAAEPICDRQSRVRRAGSDDKERLA